MLVNHIQDQYLIRQLFPHCGLLDKLQTGDLILADKGFLMNDILPDGVTVYIPPFLHKQLNDS